MARVLSRLMRKSNRNDCLSFSYLAFFAVIFCLLSPPTAFADTTTVRDLNRRFLLENLSVPLKASLGTHEEQSLHMATRDRSDWLYDAQRHLVSWAGQEHPQDAVEHLVLLSFLKPDAQSLISRMIPAILEFELGKSKQDLVHLTPIELIRLWGLSISLQRKTAVDETFLMTHISTWLQEKKPSTFEHAVLMDQVNRLHRHGQISKEAQIALAEKFMAHCSVTVSEHNGLLDEVVYHGLYLTIFATAKDATDTMKTAAFTIVAKSIENLPTASLCQMHELGFFAEACRALKADEFTSRIDVYRRWLSQHSGKWNLTLAQAHYLLLELQLHRLDAELAESQKSIVTTAWQNAKQNPLSLTMADLSSLKDFSAIVKKTMPEKASSIDLDIAQILEARLAQDVLLQDGDWFSHIQELSDYGFEVKDIRKLVAQWLKQPRDWSKLSFSEQIGTIRILHSYQDLPGVSEHITQIVNHLCHQIDTTLEISNTSIAQTEKSFEYLSDNDANRVRQRLLMKVQAAFRDHSVTTGISLAEYVGLLHQHSAWIKRLGGTFNVDDAALGLAQWVDRSDIFLPYDVERLVNLDVNYRYYAATTAPFRRVIRNMGAGAAETLERKIIQGDVQPKPVLIMMLSWHYRDQSWDRFRTWKDYVQERFNSSDQGSQNRLMWGLGLAYVQELSIYEPAPTLGTPVVRQLMSEFEDEHIRFNLMKVAYMQTLGSGQHDRASSIALAYVEETKNEQHKKMFQSLADGIALVKSKDMASAAKAQKDSDRRRLVGRIKALEKSWQEAQQRGDAQQALSLATMIDDMKSQIKK